MPLGIALVLIWLVLLLRFPRVMLPVSGALIALALLLAAGVGVKQWLDSRHLNQLHISIHYAPQDCEFGKPLKVQISNQGTRTASHISWRLQANQPGYNSNLLDVSMADAQYQADQTLAPGEQWQRCYSIPRLRSGYRPAELEYRAERLRADIHN